MPTLIYIVSMEIEIKSYRRRRCRREAIVSIVVDASHEVMIFIRSGI